MSDLARSAEPTKTLATPAALKLAPPGDLLRRLEKLYDSTARRAFELFEHNGRSFGHDLEDWFKAESELLHPVHINVAEANGKITVRAEVAGFTNNDLDVSLDGRRLTITGKRETKEERKQDKTVYTERCSNQIMRVIDLPADIDVAEASATLQDGILHFEVPKAAPGKKIAIESKPTGHKLPEKTLYPRLRSN